MNEGVNGFEASPEDAEAVGYKILDMAGRALTAHRRAAGAIAKSGIEIDGTRFEICVTVSPKPAG